MHLQESGEMYLETIYRLTKTRPSVRAIDVCEHMGFSKPSVSRAVGLLKAGGFVEVDENGHLSLTPQGTHIAERTFECHTLLKTLFIRLGVDEETADADACKIEHHISDQTLSALRRHLDQMKET
ncbi:MAG: metal-dependent transcriptional regulator [Ruminococcaceae bacterium]|nr:metal-dependent transcriptional regulator [Oscillospiraceae bacterium]